MDESVRLRALVGLPISTGGFLACDPYREFFLNMRSHLRLGACAGVLAFYRNSESCDPDFVQRLQQYGVDKVVWFAPESGAGENIRALQESRIRVVCVGEETFSPVPQHYQIQRSPAACEALRLISDQGLRVVCPGTRDTRRRRLRNDRVADLISEVGDDFTYQGSDTKDLLRYLEELEALSDSALVFKQSSFAEMIALRAPEHLFRLMEKQRVLLAQGPLTFLHNSIPVVKADTIWVDWKLVANRIVHDLLEDRVPSATSPTVFRAQLSVRESLSKRSRFFQTP